MAFLKARNTQVGRENLSEEAWLKFWALSINILSDLWDRSRADRRELQKTIANMDHVKTLIREKGDIGWVALYEKPETQFFAVSFFRIFGPLNSYHVARDILGLVLGVAQGRRAEVSDPPFPLQKSRFPLVHALLHAWDSQLRSKLIFGATVTELLRRAREEDDFTALCAAVRIDQAVLGSETAARVLRTAIATGDRSSVEALISAAENPVSVEGHYARLRIALDLLRQAGQLHVLNQRVAAELFINRTRLYPSHGKRDAERSLWRYIQRWRRELATTSS